MSCRKHLWKQQTLVSNFTSVMPTKRRKKELKGCFSRSPCSTTNPAVSGHVINKSLVTCCMLIFKRSSDTSTDRCVSRFVLSVKCKDPCTHLYFRPLFLTFFVCAWLRLHCTTVFCIFACTRRCVYPLPLPKAMYVRARVQVMDVLGVQVNPLLM